MFDDFAELQVRLLEAQKELEEEEQYEQFARPSTAAIAKKEKEHHFVPPPGFLLIVSVIQYPKTRRVYPLIFEGFDCCFMDSKLILG